MLLQQDELPEHAKPKGTQLEASADTQILDWQVPQQQSEVTPQMPPMAWQPELLTAHNPLSQAPEQQSLANEQSEPICRHELASVGFWSPDVSELESPHPPLTTRQ